MRYIFASFIVWILVRKRLGVYTALATTGNTASNAATTETPDASQIHAQ